MSMTHTATADLDVSLISPDGNEVVLFDDPPTTATATAPQINTTLDDEAAIPISVFGIHSGPIYKPELYGRLEFFKGMQAQGNWTLRVRDDLAANTGTVNSWSLNVCEAPPTTCPAPVTLFGTDFEASDAGFTHTGAQDEWERGLPSALSAPITSCHSGVNCWKTDLDNTYNNSANEDLLSPNLNLTQYVGSTIRVRWWQKYNIESASFDPAWVEVRRVGVPTDFRRLWEWKGATMSRSVGTPATTVQISAGWALMEADISDYTGKNVEIRYHLETDTSGQFRGLAVDDFALLGCNVVTAANVSVGGRVLSATGQAVFNARVVLADANGNTRVTYTSPFGYYMFENVQAGTYYARSATPGRTGDESSYRGFFRYLHDRYGLEAERMKIGDDFNPDVGYVQRADITRTDVVARFSPRIRRASPCMIFRNRSRVSGSSPALSRSVST